jgi:F-type H+-transporting ATPase subunit b
MADPHAETVATVEHAAGGAEAHVEPSFYGVTAPMFIALAMIFVIGLILWQKVPAAIGKALDKKIALIRDQLAEAKSLRQEAEGIKAEYEAKAKAAGKEAKALLKRAEQEAEAMLVKARTDAEALVERRGRMAEEKIAAEERAAIDQLRATAADAARLAATRLITERLDDKADKALVDEAIGGLGR